MRGRSQDNWVNGSWDEEFEVEPQPGTRPGRAARRRADPPVNPYAIVALVAAALCLFPVALLFGLAALSRRGGRFITALAILLGLLEVGALTAAIMMAGHTFSGFTVNVTRSGVSAAVATSHAAEPSSAAVSTPASPAPAAQPDKPVPVAPVTGTACAKSQSLLVAPTDNGPVICYAPSPGGSYLWSAPQPMADGVHAKGEACDPAQVLGYVGRTADGHALSCKGGGHAGNWQDWP